MKIVLKVIKWFFIFLLIAFLTIMVLGITFAVLEDNTSTAAPPQTVLTEPTLPIPTEKVIKPAPIKLTYVSWEQDYVGGNSIRMVVENLTDKDMAWVEYTLGLYNVKGELLKDEIRGWATVSWYDGPIAPGEHIEINGGTFYNGNFKGSIQVHKITIQYKDGTKEEIFASQFENYEQLLYSSKNSIVYTGKYSATYHTKDCQLHEHNTYDLEMTISEAQKLGKDRCSYCNPY
jgi:hypothetical protein